MRYLVVTDLHANLEALETCLSDAGRRGYDQVLVLGDLIGYGADPNAVINRVRDIQPVGLVRGNHDKVAIGIGEADGFNYVARTAAAWMLEALTPENRTWVAELPQGPLVIDDLIEICHGSPIDEDTYIFTERDAMEALVAAVRPLCLFGHTHYPVTFCLRDGVMCGIGPSRDAESRLHLDDGVKYLVNPGSVGQPRDGDPRAAYAIVDTEARDVMLYRVAYPVEETQRKVIAAGLPEALAWRLTAGR
jgi:predicted phosphodiesterase